MFQIPTDSDLGEFAAALRRRGVKNERRTDITPGVVEAIVFRDPTDLQIEVFAQCHFRAVACLLRVKSGHDGGVRP